MRNVNRNYRRARRDRLSERERAIMGDIDLIASEGDVESVHGLSPLEKTLLIGILSKMKMNLIKMHGVPHWNSSDDTAIGG